MAEELHERLRRYRVQMDAAMRPARADVPSTPSPDGRNRRLVAAIAAATLLIGGAVAFSAIGRSPARRISVATAPTEESGVSAASTDPSLPADWSWLDQFGHDMQAPPVPEGWSVMEFKELRFAVPPGWTTPPSASCATGSPPGVAVVPSSRSGECSPAAPPPPSILTLEPTDVLAPTGTPRVKVGTLWASYVAAACADCLNRYVFDGGVQVTITGPDATQILSTFTDAGRIRVLEDGPVADTAAWQAVRYGGLELQAPASWPVRDLPTSLFTTTDPSGNVNGGGGLPNPDVCGPIFSDLNDSILTGTSDLTPSCFAHLDLDLAPHDGVWIREADATQPDGAPPTASGSVGNLRVSVRQPVDPLDRALELQIETPTGTVLLSLGVGVDPMIARAILHSIRPSS